MCKTVCLGGRRMDIEPQVTGVSTDATREKNLLDRAEQLAQIGSWEWTPETNDLIWSDNLYRIFGLEPGEIEPISGIRP